MEEFERADWGIGVGEELRRLSIEAYYLDRWVSKVPTFPTRIYPIQTSLEEACPDQLPFERCMIRYENKSPKDSEFWGPVTSKEQLLNVFYTSMRCRSQPGKILCIRQWVDDIEIEYRCFWNTRLVAVAGEIIDESVLDYVSTLTIPYHRCVFDIVRIKDQFHLVEFNSWETNSGAHFFDWKADTEIFYPTETSEVVFRTRTEERRFPVPRNVVEFEEPDLTQIEILPPSRGHWLVTEEYVYIATEIYLGRFTKDLKAVNWKRVDSRFETLEMCENRVLKLGKIYFNWDLGPAKKHPVLEAGLTDTPRMSWKYGFVCRYRGERKFCRLWNDGRFQIVSLEN
jgi:hypothetical protein